MSLTSGELELEVQRLVRELADSERRDGEYRDAIAARDEFLSMVGHDLRSPVQALLFHLDSTLRMSADVERPADWFRTRTQKSLRMVRELIELLNKFLDVSRIQGGRIDVMPEDMDLVAVAREVLAAMADELAWAGCATTLEGDERAVGRWDRARIKAVIANLVTNARKYGSGAPIVVTIEAGEREARLSVADRGPGVAPADQARIFERFERVIRRGEPLVSGVGLGLWIVRHLVEAHGGTIALESEPGAGATFTIALPYQF